MNRLRDPSPANEWHSRPSAHFGGVLLDAHGIVLRESRPRPKPLTLASPPVTSRRWLSPSPCCPGAKTDFDAARVNVTTFRQSERLPSEKSPVSGFRSAPVLPPLSELSTFSPETLPPRAISLPQPLRATFESRVAFRLLQSDSARGHDREPLVFTRAFAPSNDAAPQRRPTVPPNRRCRSSGPARSRARAPSSRLRALGGWVPISAFAFAEALFPHLPAKGGAFQGPGAFHRRNAKRAQSLDSLLVPVRSAPCLATATAI